MEYGEFKAKLGEMFRAQTLGRVRQLQKMKQGGKELHDHNSEFLRIAAAAKAKMNSREINECYIKSLKDRRVRMAAISAVREPLAVLQAAAISAEAILEDEATW